MVQTFISIDQQRLLHNGKELNNYSTLRAANVSEGDLLQLESRSETIARDLNRADSCSHSPWSGQTHAAIQSSVTVQSALWYLKHGLR